MNPLSSPHETARILDTIIDIKSTAEQGSTYAFSVTALVAGLCEVAVSDGVGPALDANSG